MFPTFHLPSMIQFINEKELGLACIYQTDLKRVRLTKYFSIVLRAERDHHTDRYDDNLITSKVYRNCSNVCMDVYITEESLPIIDSRSPRVH